MGKRMTPPRLVIMEMVAGFVITSETALIF
jgi:hypothetical protein